MSRDERAGEDRRPFAPAQGSAPHDACSDARRNNGAAPRGNGGPRPRRHAQMVFITPMGIPIGPSIQEELRIPDDLDDTLPPGDLPGQLLLDLGLA